MPHSSDMAPSNMVSFDIASSAGNYAIRIGDGLFDSVLAGEGEVLFVVDAYLTERMQAAGIDAIALPAEETTKSLDRMTALIEAMKDRQTTRGTTLIAVGGGVVQDCATFAASVYMRGIPWVYVPTTLLSMADSCIGGKSSINVGKYKNIVGTFHPPARVDIDPRLAATLSAEQRIAGLCEAVKICMCRGPETLGQYLALSPSPAPDYAGLAQVIDLCLRAKKWFIEIDEFDRKERLILNFGHTFGHALEAASKFAISHGVAVGLGMIAALHLGNALETGSTPPPHVAAFRAHVVDLLAGVPGLSGHLAALSGEALMDAFAADKKHTRSEFAVIVVNAAGTVERRMLPRDAHHGALIDAAFAAMRAELI